MSILTDIIKFEVGANEWRDIIWELRGKHPMSHLYSLKLDVINLLSRYYATAAQIGGTLGNVQHGIAQREYLVPIASSVVLISTLEVLKLAYAKTFEYLSHGIHN